MNLSISWLVFGSPVDSVELIISLSLAFASFFYRSFFLLDGLAYAVGFFTAPSLCTSLMMI